MSQQAPKLVSDTHYCVVGDVSIDATAAIAPGVVLQAPSGSRIIIGKGACLAAGVCIQSRSGILTIAEGASLGANVLVIGSGEVGSNACVSAGSTVINPSVAAEVILPPDTLIESPATEDAAHSKPWSGNGRSSFQTNGFQASGSQSDGFQANSFNSNGFQADGFQSGGYRSHFQSGVSRNGSATRNSGYQNNGHQDSSYQSSAAQNDVSSSTANNGVQNGGVQSDGFHNQPSSGNQPYGYSSFQTQHSPPSSGVQSGYQPEGDTNGTYSPGGANGGVGHSADSSANGSASQITVRSSYDRVYGREQVNQLISALFPNRPSSN